MEKIIALIAGANPLVSEILSLIVIAAKAARSEELKKVIESGRKAIAALFTAKLITIEQQNKTMAFMDDIEAMVEQGIIPDHWKQDPE